MFDVGYRNFDHEDIEVVYNSLTILDVKHGHKKNAIKLYIILRKNLR